MTSISSLQGSALEEEDVPASSLGSSTRSCMLRLCRALLLPQPIFCLSKIRMNMGKCKIVLGFDYGFGDVTLDIEWVQDKTVLLYYAHP